ncbi:carbohydrate porin [Variovorax sp. PAMC26660]|uniref:carbohydrate porin n=1 Tax=Variovorax sp. PAMC26660 TaxID=2762322 RepID=UPI00164ED34A|nr:carbohydrate porin [Variovorax sp. PAMC26660]QNK65147.1 carbohydrate porin [Variovorax sp. PAMC26660]
MKFKLNRFATAAIVLLAGFQGLAHAQLTDAPPEAEVKTDPTKDFIKKVNDATGLEFWGYGRGGFFGAPKGAPKGGYSLGGDLQKYRLGNEGDNYLEFGIGKKFDLGDGIKWGVFYMPTIYNGKSGTAQAYFSLSGIFGNSATLWAGQRYHRIQDVHIVDKWVVEDGDNYGAGIDDIPLGGLGRLNVAVHTADSVDNKSGNPNNAKRINVQWRDIPTNPDGKLTVTGGLVSGNFAKGKDGGALGLMHIQKNFLLPGLKNIFIAQASSGHASLSGKFYNLDNSTTTTGLLLPPGFGASASDTFLFAPLVERTVVTPQAGAKQRRILDSMDFQIGRFGGQTLIGYQTTRPDNGPETKDFTLGQRPGALHRRHDRQGHAAASSDRNGLGCATFNLQRSQDSVTIFAVAMRSKRLIPDSSDAGTFDTGRLRRSGIWAPHVGRVAESCSESSCRVRFQQNAAPLVRGTKAALRDKPLEGACVPFYESMQRFEPAVAQEHGQIEPRALP